MAKFHITSEGRSRRCKAEVKCPLGGEHFDTMSEANDFIESEGLREYGLTNDSISKSQYGSNDELLDDEKLLSGLSSDYSTYYAEDTDEAKLFPFKYGK